MATKPAPGTGAFAFKSFVVNESFEASRFDKYHMVDEKTGDRLPYLDGVHVRKIVDDTVRLTALRAGDIDYCAAPPNSLLAKAILEKPIPGVVMDYIVVGNQTIWFNVTKPPFNNKKVRQAIAYALDKKGDRQGGFLGVRGNRQQSAFPEGISFLYSGGGQGGGFGQSQTASV